MDILGIGTEIVECLRVGRMIEQHGELFLRRVYTEREIHNCQARKRATEHFAAVWAGKEAVLKALGTNWRSLAWTDMEVRADQTGKYSVLLVGSARQLAREARVSEILLSVAHCRAYATGYALALRGGAGTWLDT
jgi:holo-[acyl-carrier protein] synthase